MFSFIRLIMSSMTQFNIPSNVMTLLYALVSLGSERHRSKVAPSRAPEPVPVEFHDTGRAVSIIRRGQTGPPPVANHTLVDHTGQLQVLPGAEGYNFLASLSLATTDDPRLAKLVRKSASSLEKLHVLLRGPIQRAPSQCTRNCPRSSREEYPAVTIGESAFISRPPSSSLDSSDMTEVYTQIQLQYKNGATATQYFNPHCSTIKPNHLKDERFKHIDINTGICLFSKSVLSTSPGHGSSSADDEMPVIPTLPGKVNPTLYEMEIITRLSSAIADTVGLVGNVHLDSENPINININIDIPDFQYYWTACDLLQRKLVTISYAQSWIATIDERRNQLEAVMTSVIRAMLRDRLLCGVKVNITSGTESAGALVKEKIALGAVPSLEEIVSALRSRGKDAAQWRELFDHLDPRHQPLNVGDLSRLMYVFKTLKPALCQKSPSTACGSIQDTPGRRLVIQVDDVNEWRIFDRAKTFLKKYSKQRYNSLEEPILVGLFVMQRIFVAGPGRSDLYLKDPGSRLCLEPEGRVVSPLDVIGATYGLHVKEQLRLSCLRAGFR